MAWTPASTTRGCCKVSKGTLDGSDDNFTFDTNMVRFWISVPAAAVTMYPASASSGNNGIVLPIASMNEYRAMGLAGRVVTFVGTSTQVLTIMEELNTVDTP